MNQFIMNNEIMTLTQFLKVNDYINSGGEAKYFLKEYVVLVNGIVCDQRGKKLYPKDIVTVNNDEYILIYDQES